MQSIDSSSLITAHSDDARLAGNAAMRTDAFFCARTCAPYSISRLINEQAGRDIIPQNTIDKPPSAELRPDQKDEDSLPPYDILDAILRMYVEEGKSAEEIAAKGFDAATVADVIGKVSRAEYKRSQYPIGPKLSTSAFSTDRIIPVSAKKGMF